SKAEGNSGLTAFTFTVILDASPGDKVFIAYATHDGTATASGDYETAAGTLVFLPGQTSQTITVLIHGDKTVETNETFTVDLGPTSGPVTLSDRQGVGTIVNDDSPAPPASGSVKVI